MRISDWSSDVCSSDLVEQLVVAQLVAGDEAADRLQRRLGRGVPQGAVVGTGADLDHAARHQLAGPRPADRFGGIDVRAEPFTEHGEARFEVEGRIGQGRPPAAIGRASWRERGCPDVSISVVAVTLKKKKK